MGQATHPTGTSTRRITLGLASILLVFATLWIFPGTSSSIRSLNLTLGSRFLSANHVEIRQPPIEGVSPDVQYDNYTLILKGQRIFLHSGEIHTFRLPVPSLWPDILQKAKAAGLNSVSVYLHMGLTNPAPAVVDFEGYRALKPLYEAAQKIGVWIVLRPGPYINAETTAGGIAHWATSQVEGTLRTNATDWRDAWTPYIKGVIEETAPYQTSSGGPVIAIQIDNEYTQNTPSRAGYFQDLVDVYRNSDIEVLLTYNDFGGGKSFVNGTGAVDLVGLDSYPQGFDCSNPLNWRPVVTNYHQYHQEINRWQPWYIPEFQGGSFDAWGPTAPGFDACRILTGPNFQSVFNLQLWASNAKLINYYMFYGGTSWGGVPHPGVYTSYDYGAAVTESRELSAKYNELKSQAMFIRSSPDFYKTDWIGDSSTGLDVTSDRNVFATLLKNPDTSASFYIVRHRDSTSNQSRSFHMNLETEVGVISFPRYIDGIPLGGRQSKVVVVNYPFGGASKLLTSTAQVYFAGMIDGRDVLILYGDASQAHETTIYTHNTYMGRNAFPQSKYSERVIFHERNALERGHTTTTIEFLEGIEGIITAIDNSQQLVLYADTDTVATFWAPTIAGAADDPFRNFWGIGTNQSILISGPHLVRNASITGNDLALYGDLKEEVRLTIVVPKHIRTMSWNGMDIAPDLQAASEVSAFGGVFVATLSPRAIVADSRQSLVVPKLGPWKYRDGLPEIRSGFDDSDWILANHTSTNIPYKPYYGDGRVLYGCDYGFCENAVLWRGHFNASGQEKSVNLSINGGTAFAASVWLNDAFLGTSFGNSTNNRNIIEETDDKFIFPAGALRANKNNVITIVQDNQGLNQTSYETYNGDTSKSPRGIRGFKLDTGEFGEWRVQGKVGGYQNFPDRVRGVLNEGGLYGERAGWHLPGYSTEGWIERDLSSGLPDQNAGIGFFSTTFDLNFETGLDVMVSFEFEEEMGQPYRCLLFVNGWMMGKRIANLGPQSKFPVHEGILDYHGKNTVVVALWAMTPNVTVSPSLNLKLDAVYDGGVGSVVTNNPPWSADDGRPT